MSYRRRLFKYRKPYQLEKSNMLFYKAMKENLTYQYNHCAAYRKILDDKGFSLDDFKSC